FHVVPKGERSAVVSTAAWPLCQCSYGAYLRSHQTIAPAAVETTAVHSLMIRATATPRGPDIAPALGDGESGARARGLGIEARNQARWISERSSRRLSSLQSCLTAWRGDGIGRHRCPGMPGCGQQARRQRWQLGRIVEIQIIGPIPLGRVVHIAKAPNICRVE